ncbi:hypothetical protein VULLAG_LOCUS326 [Vulpes lagopus]
MARAGRGTRPRGAQRSAGRRERWPGSGRLRGGRCRHVVEETDGTCALNTLGLQWERQAGTNSAVSGVRRPASAGSGSCWRRLWPVPVREWAVVAWASSKASASRLLSAA